MQVPPPRPAVVESVQNVREAPFESNVQHFGLPDSVHSEFA
jgi:hypothetical protein